MAVGTQGGERGETIHYIAGADLSGVVGLREAAPEHAERPVDRYARGLHHLAFEGAVAKGGGRDGVLLRERGAEIDGGPGERHYTPGYAIFFYDPDGIKLEVVHRPRPFTLSFVRGLVRGGGSIAGRRARACASGAVPRRPVQPPGA